MRQDLTFALRQLLRQPGLSLAAILTLGLGLGASLAVFTLVNAVLLRALPYPDADRLMTISRGPAGFRQHASHRDVDFLRERVRTCGPLAATVGGSGLNVSLAGRTSYQRDLLVSHHYFQVLGIAPRWGRAFTAEEDAPAPAPAVVLNERFVRAQQLEPGALVGRGILLGGRTHTVVGVVSAAHTRPSDPGIYRPLGRDARGGGQNLQVLCRLEHGATPVALQTELAGLLEEGRRARLFHERHTVAYEAVTRHEWEFGGLRPHVTTLVIAVVLVLLVASANAAGLLLVRASGRRREIAVRTALGAGPRRIARTLVVEGLLLAAVSGAIGLAAAPALVRALLAVAPASYADIAVFDVDAAVVAVAVLLCVLVGLAVAMAPLVEVLRFNVRDVLQDEGRSGTHGRRTVWMRHVLVGAETAVSAALLVGALLLLRTFVNLMHVDTGVDSRGVVTARMSIQGPQYDDVETLLRFFEEGVARLEQSPSIEAAAVGASLPAERALNLPARFPDSAEPGEIRAVDWRYVTPGYFRALRMRAVAGRTITEDDRRGAVPVAVVNEAMAMRFYGGVRQAIGGRIDVGSVREIVGVVRNTSGTSLGEPIAPMVYVPLAQVEARVIATAHAFFPPRWIVRATRDAASARRDLEAVVGALDPTQPFIDVQTLDALMVASVGMQRFYLVVLSAFAGFAVLLAGVGIYAAHAYAVACRTGEMGVRLALGAPPRRLFSSIVGRALLQGGAAVAAGLACAMAGARVLRSVLFEVTTTDPVAYVAVAAGLLAVVGLATVVPATRAARVDPLTALRQ
ncbi:MAG: ABC transporter permease [Vicinamibacteraceae bacterium]|nr:ABC transporter permease [Vicinamibacteraceae bacterium]